MLQFVARSKEEKAVFQPNNHQDLGVDRILMPIDGSLKKYFSLCIIDFEDAPDILNNREVKFHESLASMDSLYFDRIAFFIYGNNIPSALHSVFQKHYMRINNV